MHMRFRALRLLKAFEVYPWAIGVYAKNCIWIYICIQRRAYEMIRTEQSRKAVSKVTSLKMKLQKSSMK